MSTESNQAGTPRPEDSGRGELWVIGQAVLLAAIFLAPLVFPGRSIGQDCVGGLEIIVGIGLLLVGCVFIALSAEQLGPSLTIFPRPRDAGVFTRQGIYGKVRHPMYSGVVLIALGWALFWSNLPAVLLALALGLFFDRKARREERWLEEKYPEYTAYRQRVRRPFPWLYSSPPGEKSKGGTHDRPAV